MNLKIQTWEIIYFTKVLQLIQEVEVLRLTWPLLILLSQDNFWWVLRYILGHCLVGKST